MLTGVRNPTESLPGTAMAWVDGSQGSEECLALSLDRQTNATVSWDCSARLPFYICQSSVYLPGKAILCLSASGCLSASARLLFFSCLSLDYLLGTRAIHLMVQICVFAISHCLVTFLYLSGYLSVPGWLPFCTW